MEFPLLRTSEGYQRWDCFSNPPQETCSQRREKCGAARDPVQKFVFAHIVSPHGPFIFGPKGEPIPVGVDKQEGYLNQVIFINNKLLPMLKNIIEKSHTPPIILLQADHGGVFGSMVTRMQILNAYYLPDGGDQRLYDRISPVNTFRLVFDHYFDANYSLLPDTSYFSSYQEPYQFTIIPETRTDCR